MTKRRKQLGAVAVAMALVAACGGSDEPAAEDDEPTEEEQVTTTVAEPADEATTTAAEPTPTSEPEPAGGGISSFDQAQPAVVQIVAQGSFRDPEVGMVTTAGSGSGFIISEDGYAVTNNHVVTGAATLEVFIGGDDTGYNATVVGVSECNDLALIQIDSNDALPYLEWADGDPTVGTEVYAAGFPLGDPEYTLTRGIVAKANAGGDTSWASIDSTIEHDAAIQPGNSGGPLVGADGRVVAVNYSGSSPTNQSQFFAISSPLAQDVVERLRDGDFESLGINGTAVLDEASGIAGVWVAGTAPGSPASNAGILPGDIVTSMNGLPIGTDGSMKDYCDVLRTSGDRPITVEVLRFDSQELLRGEINGEIPLEPFFSFAAEIDDEVDVAADPGTTYTGIQTLVDDSGSITVDVPAEWADVDTTALVLDDGTPQPWISASTSLDDLYSTYDVPGIFMAALPEIPAADIPATIADFAPSVEECAYDDGLTDYDDGAFGGQYQLWGDCGGVGAALVILIANAYSGQGSVVIGVQMVTEADFDALDTIMATFNYL
ncbi:MAG: S1C family serine protease [Acidimicrobiia bacterium]